MQCPECNSNNTHEFFTEEIGCTHCGEINVISYNVCEECSLVWKAVDGRLLDKLNYIEETDIIDVTPDDSDRNSMQDLIHKCLRCGAFSYEINKKRYRCSECDFEWRII